MFAHNIQETWYDEKCLQSVVLYVRLQRAFMMPQHNVLIYVWHGRTFSNTAELIQSVKDYWNLSGKIYLFIDVILTNSISLDTVEVIYEQHSNAGENFKQRRNSFQDLNLGEL